MYHSLHLPPPTTHLLFQPRRPLLLSPTSPPLLLTTTTTTTTTTATNPSSHRRRSRRRHLSPPKSSSSSLSLPIDGFDLRRDIGKRSDAAAGIAERLASIIPGGSWWRLGTRKRKGSVGGGRAFR
uniref:Uncharacterized protein n=1 Tax=Ananas comosus var. bracteatus TaxID=296719 RepID=A0A6V7QT59_ANACO